MTSDTTHDGGSTTVVVEDNEWDEDNSELFKYAKRELEFAGLFDGDADYNNLAEHVLDLVRTFARYGHSGGSAYMTLDILDRVLRFTPLTPVTNNPDEWMEIHDGIASEPEPLWQCRRLPAAFSHDGGKTFYVLDEPMGTDGNLPIHTAAESESHA